jgi:hypothetical protein
MGNPIKRFMLRSLEKVEIETGLMVEEDNGNAYVESFCLSA